MAMPEERKVDRGVSVCADGCDRGMCCSTDGVESDQLQEEVQRESPLKLRSEKGWHCHAGRIGGIEKARGTPASADRSCLIAIAIPKTSRSGERRACGSMQAEMRHLPSRWPPQGVPGRRGEQTGWRRCAASAFNAT